MENKKVEYLVEFLYDSIWLVDKKFDTQDKAEARVRLINGENRKARIKKTETITTDVEYDPGVVKFGGFIFRKTLGNERYLRFSLSDPCRGFVAVVKDLSEYGDYSNPHAHFCFTKDDARAFANAILASLE